MFKLRRTSLRDHLKVESKEPKISLYTFIRFGLIFEFESAMNDCFDGLAQLKMSISKSSILKHFVIAF